MLQAKLSYRITRVKFSYFTSDWYWVRDLDNLDHVEYSIQARERVVKGDDLLTVDHVRVVSVRTDSKPSKDQIALDDVRRS